MRSLNVAMRQNLDLYACVRPIRYFPGVSTPMADASLTDMVVFRENTEDIYAGIEWPTGSQRSPQAHPLPADGAQGHGHPLPGELRLGIKPVSKEGSQRLVRKAIQYAIENDRVSVTLVHKGNIMKFTEGAFMQWGYLLAKEEYGAQPIGAGPWCSFKNPINGKEIVVKDVIADNFLQQVLLRPEDYDVIATLNLNGDYISDALAAQVGGIGIAPGGNIGDGLAVFEATHGTAPGFAGKDRVNPGSIILSAEMMLRYIGWKEAAELIMHGVAETIAAKEMTYDLARLREAIRADQARHRRAQERRGRPAAPDSRRHADDLFGFRRRHHQAHEVGGSWMAASFCPDCTLCPRLASFLVKTKRAEPGLLLQAGAAFR